MHFFNERYIKLLGSLILAFLSAQILINTVFIARTPRINPRFIAFIKNLPVELTGNGEKMLAFILRKPALSNTQKMLLTQWEKIPDSGLRQVATGVYAAEDKINNIVYIRVKENAEWEERVLRMNGKEIRVRFPKGTFR